MARLGPNVSLKDVDKGFQALSRGLGRISAKTKGAGGPVVELGITDGIDPKVLKYALVHEFGSATVQARSYIRSTIDENTAKYKPLLKGIATAAMAASTAAAASGGEVDLIWADTVARGLEQVGRMATADIRAKIKSNIGPPLKPETLARKAARGQPSTALIAEGLLIRSVAHTVEKEGSKKKGAGNG